jgi:hypothetical protein
MITCQNCGSGSFEVECMDGMDTEHFKMFMIRCEACSSDWMVMVIKKPFKAVDVQ